MGLTNRLFRLARANLNALLESVGDQESRGVGMGVDDLTDEELEAELERRRQRRQREAAERAVRDRAERAARERFGGSESPGHASSRAQGPASRSRRRRQDPRLARYYAKLEVPYGADLETVKRSYRRLMRKYHPDRHARDPKLQQAATGMAQALSEAYSELEKALS